MTKRDPELQPDKKAKIAFAFLRGRIVRDSAKSISAEILWKMSIPDFFMSCLHLIQNNYKYNLTASIGFKRVSRSHLMHLINPSWASVSISITAAVLSVCWTSTFRCVNTLPQSANSLQDQTLQSSEKWQKTQKLHLTHCRPQSVR